VADAVAESDAAAEPQGQRGVPFDSILDSAHEPGRSGSRSGIALTSRESRKGETRRRQRRALLTVTVITSRKPARSNNKAEHTSPPRRTTMAGLVFFRKSENTGHISKSTRPACSVYAPGMTLPKWSSEGAHWILHARPPDSFPHSSQRKFLAPLALTSDSRRASSAPCLQKTQNV
jgi:hypothetical protein